MPRYPVWLGDDDATDPEDVLVGDGAGDPVPLGEVVGEVPPWVPGTVVGTSVVLGDVVLGVVGSLGWSLPGLGVVAGWFPSKALPMVVPPPADPDTG